MDDISGIDAVNRAAAEHVERVRERLAAGRDEIERQKQALSETREHIDGVRAWIAESDRLAAVPQPEL